MIISGQALLRAAFLLSFAVTPLLYAADVPANDPWLNPPPQARLRAYWWWLNGNVDKQAITRDLEEMKRKGFGGAVIMDADGSSQGGHEQVPAGPPFGSAEWKELFAHSCQEATRLELELSLNIQSGWNLGGPTVNPQDAVKRITKTEIIVEGGQTISTTFATSGVTGGFYQDIVTLAIPVKSREQKSLLNWRERALHQKIELGKNVSWFEMASAPPTISLLTTDEPVPGESVTGLNEVINLTSGLSPEGMLTWDAPPGRWKILRYGATLGDLHEVSTSSDGWKGLALDPLDAGAFTRYWDTVVEPILAAGGEDVGKSLKYLHTDSWELDAFNWTPTLIEEFRKRRGYDMTPWFPALTGNVIASRDASQRFLADFRKTIGDLTIDNHYRPFLERARKHGLGIHPEAGGPHYTGIDAQRALGFSTIPTSEFWAEAKTHRTTDVTRFFVKQPASAAHTYGKSLVAAEGFTTVGPHWQETLWDNLKPSFDMACTEGLNLLIWHAFVCSPEKMGIPGQQYFAGTHLNPNVTWWNQGGPFFTYLNRCQHMLQQGQFRAEALVYYGDHVPNFSRSRSSDPGKLGAGYNYDVITEEAILTRLSVKHGRLVLPDGMSYRLLTLPDYPAMSLPVLRKVRDLVQAGATIVGPRPLRAASLADIPDGDAELGKITEELWSGTRPGKGRVFSSHTARQVLEQDNVPPDFSFTGSTPEHIRYIHRGSEESEIYFIANRDKSPVTLQASFRTTGRAPELWDAVTGSRTKPTSHTDSGGLTRIPLALPPCGSIFVVFPKTPSADLTEYPATLVPLIDIPGPWTVRFSSMVGGPEDPVAFEALTDWTAHADPRIKFYSGTATYHAAFGWGASKPAGRVVLDLGFVRELATVKLNGKVVRTLWAPPFQADITEHLESGSNALEIEVTNFWPNRIIGDASLPPNQRTTHTNIRTLTEKTPLMTSGLLGPVRLLQPK
jgi:hypothetical protein